MIAQFTAKTINLEKAIYFLSLMSCSINKIKSHVFFICKNCIFSDLFDVEIKIAPGNGERGRADPRPAAIEI